MLLPACRCRCHRCCCSSCRCPLCAAAGELLLMIRAVFAVTYLVHGDSGPWVAGVMTQRQPIECPTGFGPRPSLSLFLYNQDGHQAIARPFLDGHVPPPGGGKSGPDNNQDRDAVAAAAQEAERKAQQALLPDPGGGNFDPVAVGRAQYLDAWDSQR